MSDINVTINDIANCTIPVVNKAKYLGSILDRELGHEADVDARIAAASSAFAKLKPLVFKNKNISIEAKRAAYVACPHPNMRANERKWRPIGSNENMPWGVVTIPDELEKNGQP